MPIQKLSMASSRHCVVLIHGTWGGDSAWALEESHWVANLRDSADILRFTWSGLNRQTARIAASVELAECLSTDLRAYETVHLVAHSHGGNIAARAAGLVPKRVTSIVTLGTPYIVAESYGSAVIEESAIIALFTFLVIAGCFTILLVAPYFPALFPPDLSEAEAKVRGPILTTVLLFAAIGIYLLSKKAIERVRERIGQRYHRFGYNSVETLSIYYRADEAYGLLRRSTGLKEFIQKIPVAFQHAIETTISDSGKFRIFSLGTLIFVIVNVAYAISLKDWGWISIAGGVLVMLMAAIILLPILNWLTPIWSGAATLGADCWIDMMFARVYIRRTPAGPAPVSASELPFDASFIETKSRLVHSDICHDRRAIDLAVAWISERSSRPSRCMVFE